MSMINDSSPKHTFHQHLHLWPTTYNIFDSFLTPPLLHNQVALVTHSLSQCGDPYYIWHQFRIAFGTTTSYYICDLN